MPYRIKASLGPTFRYMRAITIMSIKSPRTSEPAMTTTSVGNPNITASLLFHCYGLIASYFSPINPSLREFIPALDVGDSLLVALDDYLCALFNGLAVAAARTGAAPR